MASIKSCVFAFIIKSNTLFVVIFALEMTYEYGAELPVQLAGAKVMAVKLLFRD